jgi:hypothetical protein
MKTRLVPGGRHSIVPRDDRHHGADDPSANRSVTSCLHRPSNNHHQHHQLVVGSAQQTLILQDICLAQCLQRSGPVNMRETHDLTVTTLLGVAGYRSDEGGDV